MALFDNFDDYNKALETARKSQGTLQEQQDVYMESTKAHLNELKASWEDFYDSLADTDSINTLIDGLSLVVSTMASFTDALGGGMNVLTLFGGIAAKTFSSHIGKGINEIITRRQTGQRQ